MIRRRRLAAGPCARRDRAQRRLGRARCIALGTAALAAALALPALADDAVASGSRSDAQWLQAIQDAARHQSFVGTIVYHRGDEMHASRVVRSYDGAILRERVLTLDGQQREYIRQGDEVQCLYPQVHRVVLEHGGRHAFPEFAEIEPADVLAHYELKQGGSERVAGSACDLLALVPRDRVRYGYRLCVDRATGLLLKTQTLNEAGDILEQMAFTEVHVGERIDPAQLKPSWSTAGWTVVRRQSQPTELSQQGWSVTPPSGFHRLIEVIRHLAGADDAAPRSALQAVYSDGLATVSVFIEPGAPPLDEPNTTQRRGSVAAFSRQIGDARVTVVGEIPPATAESIAESVVHSSPQRP